MSIFGFLTVAFVVLKLCGVIAWSWLWVLAPVWIPLALYLFVISIIGAIGFFATRAFDREFIRS